MKPHELHGLHFQTLVSRWKHNYAPATAYLYTCHLRALARAIANLTGHDLARTIPRLHQPRPRTQTISSEQIRSLLAYAEPWMRVFITLAAALGLRHAEALDVRPASFNPEQHTIRFVAKGGDTHTMPTTEEVEEMFATAPAGDPMTPLVELYRGKPVQQCTVWWAWNRLKKKAGLPEDLRPHDLRRSAAVAGYELTHDLRFVWQLLRHRNLSTTARYLEHVNPAEIRAILQQIWTPRTELKQ